MWSLGNLFATVLNAARFGESRLFDLTRHVQTSGDLSLQQAGILPEDSGDSYRYVPARAANIRSALQSLPLLDLSRYTFVDLGSGKGRSLFIAAEFPFQHIVGVEFSSSLHQMARQNVASFHYKGRSARQIETLNQNANAFTFPDGPLVVYMFNPFGQNTMHAVLANLEKSLRATPRHTVVILLWPVLGQMVVRIPGMRKIQANKRYEIFEAHSPRQRKPKPGLHESG